MYNLGVRMCYLVGTDWGDSERTSWFARLQSGLTVETDTKNQHTEMSDCAIQNLEEKGNAVIPHV